MKRVLLAALAVLSAGAVQAFSFVGDDWVLDYEVVYHVRTAAANSDLPETANDVPISISQSVTNAFSFPYTLGVVEGTGDFTVSGTTVTDINSGKTTDPFQTIFNGNLETVRITYDTWTLTGEVTATNPGITDAFGDRAYQITGNGVEITDVNLEVLVNNVWVDFGNNSSVEVVSWSLEREAVPEPMTMVGLGGLALVALRKRKKA